MTTYTIVCPVTSNSGCVSGFSNTSYAEMLSGENLGVNTGTMLGIGQSYSVDIAQWQGFEDFLEFDLSALPSVAIIDSASIRLFFSTVFGDDDNQYSFSPYSWSTLSIPNWLTPTQINAIPNVFDWGSLSTSDIIQNSYNTMSLDPTMFQEVHGARLQMLVFDFQMSQSEPPSGDDISNLEAYGSDNPPSVSITYHMPAPTVASIASALSQLAGGATATITGTGFSYNDPGTISVTICGISATDVTVVSDTQVTCTVPASSTAQVGDVVVTTANNGSGTLTDGFTYTQVKDTHVQLIKAGSIVGDDRALTTLEWPLDATAQTYGSATDLWGETWTPSDVNASNFGAALSANVGAGQASVESTQVTVYFATDNNSQPGTFLTALSVDTSGATVTPVVYKLPSSGFSMGMDRSIGHAVSDANFYTSRLHLPSRNLEKSWRCVEFYADLDPEVNTPGLQVWAAIDDGDFFQLNDSSGNPATIFTSGAQRVFFPTTSNGHYVQLKVSVPALGTGQVPVSVIVRDLALRLSLRPEPTDAMTATLILGPGEYEDRTSTRNTTQAKREFLESLFVPGGTVSYRDPVTGVNAQMLALGLQFEEVVFPGKSESTLVAHVTLRQTEYA